MELNKNLKTVLPFLLIFIHSQALAQYKEISYDIRPVYGNKFEFSDPPAYIQPQNSIGLSGGLNCLILSKAGFGVRGGISLGYHAQAYKINDKTNRYPMATYIPLGINVEPLFRFKALQKQFDFFAGYELRKYFTDGVSSTSVATDDGRYYSFDFHYNTEMDFIQSNGYGGITFLHQLASGNTLSIGFFRNLGLEKFRPGVFTGENESGKFQTTFSSNSDSYGLRFMFSLPK